MRMVTSSSGQSCDPRVSIVSSCTIPLRISSKMLMIWLYYVLCMRIMLVHVVGEISDTIISSGRMVWYMSDVHEETTQSDHAIVMVARKYGINVLEDTVGFRTCSTPGCVIDEMRVKRLHVHRDIGHTACAGKNLYSLIDDIRVRVANRVWQVTPVYNMETPHIDPLPEEDKVTVSLGGKPIRIRLSYPLTDTVSLSLASPGFADLRIWARKITGNTTKNVNVWIVWKNWLTVKVWDKTYTWANISYAGRLIRIDSWSRVPAWDTAGKYNDNIFRGKITLRNEGWKLLVINELPVEDYLRWLWEVSNTDNTEKIKVITLAARSYARYYMDRANRKYNTNLYDGSDDPDSFQKYLGYSYEMRSPNVSQVVKDTLGQVITYKKKIIKAWYFSSSAGRTLSYREYCEQNTGKTCTDIPYLQSVTDPAGQGKIQSGHGVGISGIWATAMAEAGKSYKEIIQYYMNWVAIEKK